MDSVTQIALGAAVGEAVLGRKIGNKALLWGAIGGTIPDLDVIPSQFFDPVTRIEMHRAFSHSILFCIIAALILGYLLKFIYKRSEPSRNDWTLMMFLTLFTHILLDAFTTWGTQLFYPHPYRVALNNIFIIDPLYTIPLVVTLIWLMFKNRNEKIRRVLAYSGLFISTFYLVITLMNKYVANNAFEKALAEQNIKYDNYTSVPTVFNTILWTVIAETEDSYHIGNYSILDSHIDIEFREYPKNHHLIDDIKDHPRIKTIKLLTRGYYMVQQTDSAILIYDLKLGDIYDFGNNHYEPIFWYAIEYGADGQQDLQIKESWSVMEPSAEYFIPFLKRLLGN